MDPYKPPPNIKGQRVKFTSAEPFTPSFIRECLPNAPPDTYATRLEGKQIQLDNPKKDSKAKIERDEKKKRRNTHRAKRKAEIISKRRGMELGLWEFDKKLAKWDMFWPIHQMWLQYISELLDLPKRPAVYPDPNAPPLKAPDSSSLHPKLVKADFHGSIITVKQCRNASRVGLGGIVMQETESVFKIVTKSNKMKVLPKQGTIFTFSIPFFATCPESKDTDPRLEFELYGNQFQFRASDRASRKFKAKETIEI